MRRRIIDAVKDILAWTGIFAFAAVASATALIYLRTGEIYFDHTLLLEILRQNIGYLLLAVVILFFLLVAVAKYYVWVLGQRKNCQVQYVDLEQIAKDWIAYETIEKNIRQKLAEEKKQPEQAAAPAAFDLSAWMLEISMEPTRAFVKSVVSPALGKLNPFESRIIFELLLMLEKDGQIPSVASLYENDPEKMVYAGKEITLSGKTSYQILKEYTLYDHTMRVARIMDTMLKEKNSANYSLLVGRAMIVSLAHDIGKIIVKSKDARIKEEMYRLNPHEQMSAIIMQTLYPDYPYIQNVVSAIKSHHIAKPQGDLASMLKEADKKAREEEISLWLIKHKEEQRKDEDDAQVVQGSEAETAQMVLNQAPTTPEAKETNPDVAKQDLKTRSSLKKGGSETSLKDGDDEAKQSPEGQSGETNQEKKSDHAGPRNGKRKAPGGGETPEFDFLAAFGDDLARALSEKINSTEDDFKGDHKVISVSYFDTVLYDFVFFKRVIEGLLKRSVDKNLLLSVVRQLKDAGVIKFIDTEREFTVSKFIIEDRGTRTERNFVPISSDFLHVKSDELEEAKRNNPHLRNMKIMLFSNK